MSGHYLFIVGCARTGTTLLRQILSTSSRVCIAPETHFMRRFNSDGSTRTQRWGNLDNDAHLDRMIDFMYWDASAGSAYWGWLQRNVDRPHFQQALQASDRTMRGIFEVLMQVYAEQTLGRSSGDLMLGEKTPAHVNYIPTLLEWFPQDPVIHTFRDPRAILVSELKKMRKKGRGGPRQVLRSVPGWVVEPLELPFELVHTTRSWLQAAQWHTLCEKRYPEQYTLVRFEDLVAEPEQQIRRLCRFLDLPFEAAMVNEVHVVGSSYQPGHRGAAGFDRSALDRWKSSLHPAVKLWFSLLGREQMKKFGYS